MTSEKGEGVLDVACHINALTGEWSLATLEPALDALAAAGYSRVVFPPLDPDTTDATTLGSALADRGLTAITIAGGQVPGADVSSSDPDERAAGAAVLRGMVDFTAALGSDQMNGVPYGIFGRPHNAMSEAARALAAREVGTVADYAHERGVMMTFEVLNRYETSAINTAAQAVDFVAASGSEHLRIHLDTFHMSIEESDIGQAIRAALPVLGYLELGQSGRGPLGRGTLDIVDIARQAMEDGYTGRWGVEAFSRSILVPFVSDMLAIWRAPYDDGMGLAVEAVELLNRAQSLAVRSAGPNVETE